MNPQFASFSSTRNFEKTGEGGQVHTSHCGVSPLLPGAGEEAVNCGGKDISGEGGETQEQVRDGQGVREESSCLKGDGSSDEDYGRKERSAKNRQGEAQEHSLTETCLFSETAGKKREFDKSPDCAGGSSCVPTSAALADVEDSPQLTRNAGYWLSCLLVVMPRLGDSSEDVRLLACQVVRSLLLRCIDTADVFDIFLKLVASFDVSVLSSSSFCHMGGAEERGEEPPIRQSTGVCREGGMVIGEDPEQDSDSRPDCERQKESRLSSPSQSDKEEEEQGRIEAEEAGLHRHKKSQRPGDTRSVYSHHPSYSSSSVFIEDILHLVLSCISYDDSEGLQRNLLSFFLLPLAGDDSCPSPSLFSLRCCFFFLLARYKNTIDSHAESPVSLPPQTFVPKNSRDMVMVATPMEGGNDGGIDASILSRGDSFRGAHNDHHGNTTTSLVPHHAALSHPLNDTQKTHPPQSTRIGLSFSSLHHHGEGGEQRGRRGDQEEDVAVALGNQARNFSAAVFELLSRRRRRLVADEEKKLYDGELIKMGVDLQTIEREAGRLPGESLLSHKGNRRITKIEESLLRRRSNWIRKRVQTERGGVDLFHSSSKSHAAFPPHPTRIGSSGNHHHPGPSLAEGLPPDPLRFSSSSSLCFLLTGENDARGVSAVSGGREGYISPLVVLHDLPRDSSPGGQRDRIGHVNKQPGEEENLPNHDTTEQEDMENCYDDHLRLLSEHANVELLALKCVRQMAIEHFHSVLSLLVEEEQRDGGGEEETALSRAPQDEQGVRGVGGGGKTVRDRIGMSGGPSHIPSALSLNLNLPAAAALNITSLSRHTSSVSGSQPPSRGASSSSESVFSSRSKRNRPGVCCLGSRISMGGGGRVATPLRGGCIHSVLMGLYAERKQLLRRTLRTLTDICNNTPPTINVNLSEPKKQLLADGNESVSPGISNTDQDKSSLGKTDQQDGTKTKHQRRGGSQLPKRRRFSSLAAYTSNGQLTRQRQFDTDKTSDEEAEDDEIVSVINPTVHHATLLLLLLFNLHEGEKREGRGGGSQDVEDHVHAPLSQSPGEEAQPQGLFAVSDVFWQQQEALEEEEEEDENDKKRDKSKSEEKDDDDDRKTKLQERKNKKGEKSKNEADEQRSGGAVPVVEDEKLSLHFLYSSPRAASSVYQAVRRHLPQLLCTGLLRLGGCYEVLSSTLFLRSSSASSSVYPRTAAEHKPSPPYSLGCEADYADLLEYLSGLQPSSGSPSGAVTSSVTFANSPRKEAGSPYLDVPVAATDENGDERREGGRWRRGGDSSIDSSRRGSISSSPPSTARPVGGEQGGEKSGAPTTTTTPIASRATNRRGGFGQYGHMTLVPLEEAVEASIGVIEGILKTSGDECYDLFMHCEQNGVFRQMKNKDTYLDAIKEVITFFVAAHPETASDILSFVLPFTERSSSTVVLSACQIIGAVASSLVSLATPHTTPSPPLMTAMTFPVSQYIGSSMSRPRDGVVSGEVLKHLVEALLHALSQFSYIPLLIETAARDEREYNTTKASAMVHKESATAPTETSPAAVEQATMPWYYFGRAPSVVTEVKTEEEKREQEAKRKKKEKERQRILKETRQKQLLLELSALGGRTRRDTSPRRGGGEGLAIRGIGGAFIALRILFTGIADVTHLWEVKEKSAREGRREGGENKSKEGGEQERIVGEEGEEKTKRTNSDDDDEEEGETEAKFFTSAQHALDVMESFNMGLCLAPFLSLVPTLVNPFSSSSCLSPLSRSFPSSSLSSSTFLDVLYIAAAEGASEACEACVHACTTACAVSLDYWPSKECPLGLLKVLENSILFSPDSLTSLLLHTTNSRLRSKVFDLLSSFLVYRQQLRLDLAALSLSQASLPHSSRAKISPRISSQNTFYSSSTSSSSDPGNKSERLSMIGTPAQRSDSVHRDAQASSNRQQETSPKSQIAPWRDKPDERHPFSSSVMTGKADSNLSMVISNSYCDSNDKPAQVQHGEWREMTTQQLDELLACAIIHLVSSHKPTATASAHLLYRALFPLLLGERKERDMNQEKRDMEIDDKGKSISFKSREEDETQQYPKERHGWRDQEGERTKMFFMDEDDNDDVKEGRRILCRCLRRLGLRIEVYPRHQKKVHSVGSVFSSGLWEDPLYHRSFLEMKKTERGEISGGHVAFYSSHQDTRQSAACQENWSDQDDDLFFMRDHRHHHSTCSSQEEWPVFAVSVSSPFSLHEGDVKSFLSGDPFVKAHALNEFLLGLIPLLIRSHTSHDYAPLKKYTSPAVSRCSSIAEDVGDRNQEKGETGDHKTTKKRVTRNASYSNAPASLGRAGDDPHISDPSVMLASPSASQTLSLSAPVFSSSSHGLTRLGDDEDEEDDHDEMVFERRGSSVEVGFPASPCYFHEKRKKKQRGVSSRNRLQPSSLKAYHPYTSIALRNSSLPGWLCRVYTLVGMLRMYFPPECWGMKVEQEPHLIELERKREEKKIKKRLDMVLYGHPKAAQAASKAALQLSFLQAQKGSRSLESFVGSRLPAGLTSVFGGGPDDAEEEGVLGETGGGLFKSFTNYFRLPQAGAVRRGDRGGDEEGGEEEEEGRRRRESAQEGGPGDDHSEDSMQTNPRTTNRRRTEGAGDESCNHITTTGSEVDAEGEEGYKSSKTTTTTTVTEEEGLDDDDETSDQSERDEDEDPDAVTDLHQWRYMEKFLEFPQSPKKRLSRCLLVLRVSPSQSRVEAEDEGKKERVGAEKSGEDEDVAVRRDLRLLKRKIRLLRLFHRVDLFLGSSCFALTLIRCLACVFQNMDVDTRRNISVAFLVYLCGQVCGLLSLSDADGEAEGGEGDKREEETFKETNGIITAAVDQSSSSSHDRESDDLHRDSSTVNSLSLFRKTAAVSLGVLSLLQPSIPSSPEEEEENFF
ncbi:nascent polypeptide-associated complex alpha [Cystoisospora suis]|uniref:Nascent polypeptide-associated complex alpha n=1 Tax=Cystoisospora suis TaxID=483139 RepID=A0A2C6KI10_9APIC|nr:nascent polypeptide-associated complex alpha [Cystoisospora suis]